MTGRRERIMELVALLRDKSAKLKQCRYCKYLGDRHAPDCPLAGHADSAALNPTQKSEDVGYSGPQFWRIC